MQLFSEVGNVQDCHLQPQEGRGGGYTYGLVYLNWPLIPLFLVMYV